MLSCDAACSEISLTMLTINIIALFIDLSPIPRVGLSIRVSVRKVHCGKTVDWIQMPFSMVSGVSRGMGVLDGVHVGGDALFPNYFGSTYYY